MIRELPDGIEVDDSKDRIDRTEVHRFLSEDAYWALGRSRELQDRLIDTAARVVGVYDGNRQIGFARAATDGNSFVYLADVYVLEEYRGRGLGEELVREMVENGDLGAVAFHHEVVAAETPPERIHFELFAGTHRGLTWRYPLSLAFLVGRLSMTL